MSIQLRTLRRKNNGLVTLLVLSFLVTYACTETPPGMGQEVFLAEKIELKMNEWTTTKAPEPLMAPPGNNSLCFYVKDPFSLGDEVMRIESTNGEVIELIAKIENELSSDPLYLLGYAGDSQVCLSTGSTDELSPPYAKILLSTSSHIVIHNVYWYSAVK